MAINFYVEQFVAAKVAATFAANTEKAFKADKAVATAWAALVLHAADKAETALAAADKAERVEAYRRRMAEAEATRSRLTAKRWEMARR